MSSGLISRKVAAMAENQENLRHKSQTSAHAATPAVQSHCRRLRIFNEAELVAASTSTTGVGQSRSGAFIARLQATGSSRPLIPPVPTWKANLEWLHHVFPGFEEVLEFGVAPSLRAAASGALPRPTPLLVTGATAQEVATFVRAVAGALDVAFFQFDVAAVAGSTCSQPSAVLTTLAFGTESHAAVANPTGSAHLGLLGTPSELQSMEYLAKLLNVDDARMAQDPAVPEIHFDASFVKWILSCTSIDHVPPAILNQCHVMRASPSRNS